MFVCKYKIEIDCTIPEIYEKGIDFSLTLITICDDYKTIRIYLMDNLQLRF